MIWHVENLIETAQSNQKNVGGRWVPARPVDSTSIIRRMCAAWQVLIGKADIVIWPEDQ